MVTFDLLPSEIIDAILEHVDKPSLLPLRLTGHRISTLTSPHIYAHIVKELQEQEHPASPITITTSSSSNSLLKQEHEQSLTPKTPSTTHSHPRQNNSRPTYLHTAATHPDLLTPLQTLLSLHCSPNTINFHDETPLHLAIRHNNLLAIKALLDAGADPNAEIRPHGWTPLLLAARYGFLECVKLLLLEEFSRRGEAGEVDGENTVDINKRGCHGWTALHVARWYGHDDVARLLVERGAREDIKDNDGVVGRDVRRGTLKGGWGVV